MKRISFAMILVALFIAGCDCGDSKPNTQAVVQPEPTPVPLRFEVIGHRNHTLTPGGSAIRIIVIRDNHTGDEYMALKDGNGLAMTRVPATGR